MTEAQPLPPQPPFYRVPAVVKPVASPADLRLRPPPAITHWKGMHQDQAFIVCGTGPSLALLPRVRIPTIGVNAIWPKYRVDYLLTISPPHLHSPESQAAMMKAHPVAFFMPHEARQPWRYLPRPIVGMNYRILSVGTRIRRFGCRTHDVIYGIYTSVTSAACLAAYMGARSVGVIGCDLEGHAELEAKAGLVNKAWARMAYHLEQEMGCAVVNLSPGGLVTALPRVPLDDFLGEHHRVAVASDPA